MDAIRTGLLRVADDVSLALQNAARSFAFYSDGRDFVHLRQTESGPIGEFPDHADEGWPALAFPLPDDALFMRASSALLTRLALFSSTHSVAELGRRFKEAGLPVMGHSRTAWSAKLSDQAVMKVIRPKSHFGAPSPPSLILVSQRRTPEAIVEAIKSMAGRQPRSS